MIKLKKLLIQNFKGISSKLIVNLGVEDGGSVNVNILAGPNGFGKTTIFDAIELCLTGKFGRIEQFQKVQKANADRNKPFFQNIENEDVVIRLWIQNEEESYVLTKWYDSESPIKKREAGRENQPSDSHNFFQTYITKSTEYFSSTSQKDFGNKLETPSEYINELIYGEESFTELSSIYYLFNYLQQEDSIYFLRQKEDEKGKLMGFLFNMEEEEQRKNELEEVATHLRNEEFRLNQYIEKLRIIDGEKSQVEFKKLFVDKDFEFDLEKPFQSITDIDTANEKQRQWVDWLNDLLEFRKTFEPNEFEKYSQYRLLQQVLTESEATLRALIIKNLDTDKVIEQLETINQKLDRAEKFEAREDKNTIQDKILEFFAKDKEAIEEYRQFAKELNQLNNELNSFDKIISDLNAARLKCITEFEKVKDHEHIDDNKCPLCDSVFSSYEDLIGQIEEKTKALMAFNNDRLVRKQNLIDKIEAISNDIASQIEIFREDNKPVNQEILAILRDLPNRKEGVQKLLDRYPELNEENNSNLYLDSVPLDENEINTKLEQLKDFFRNSVLPKFRYDSSKIERASMYEEYFDKNNESFLRLTLDQITRKKEYINAQFMDFNNTRLSHLNSRLKKLRAIKKQTDEILDTIKGTMKNFSIEMIDKIKVPFYIYSGKILQNYQQGMGIFIEIHPTGGSYYIRFKTGNRSDHDIVYHLSSGQLAVVAIAWCLSLNKVYNTNQHFKFLAIDDPIQTMDDLNVHMFIELLRYEFLDYQILISTHDDFNSLYMKYKFDKFGMNSIIQNIQKKVVEQSNT